MLDPRALRRKLAAAIVAAPLVLATPSAETRRRPHPAGERADAALCAVYEAGRESHWCGPPRAARALASRRGDVVAGCPDRLDAGAVRRRGPASLQPTEDAEEERPVIDLLRVASRQASEACAAQRCCYVSVAPGEKTDTGLGGGGRLLIDGRVVRAAVVEGRLRWASPSLAAARLGARLTDEERAAIARGWLDNALLEHASVASFARATLELLAAGAPPWLVRATRRAALDEVRHAQQCFGIVQSVAGLLLEPGPLPSAAPRGGDLARLAANTFEESCVSETIATLGALDVTPAVAHEPIRDVLSGVIHDEAEHAAMGWACVSWAVRRGGEPVLAAVLQQAERLSARLHRAPDLAEPAASTALLRSFGLLPVTDQLRIERAAWSDTITPLLETLAGVADQGPCANVWERGA